MPAAFHDLEVARKIAHLPAPSTARQPLVKHPGDYGMQYRDITFQSEDGATIHGWLIEGNADTLIVVTHPMPFSRYGFSVKNQGMMKVSKVEVELLRTAKQLNDAGYHILTFDFRNHGESDAANDGACGVGLNEWPDVVGAMNYIENDETLKQMDVGFVSHCMGANATIMAMKNAPSTFEGVKCLVAVQPVSMEVLVPNLLASQFPIFKRCTEKIDKQCAKMTGNRLAEMSPLEYVDALALPTIYVQVESDPWTTPSDVQGFYDRTPDPKELFWIEGDLERFDGYNYFGEHPEKLLAFLNKYM